MKKVFITGANKGIGFATAKLLLQKGYYVYLGSRNFHNGISAIQELKADGLKNVECVQIDVTKDSSVKSARELLSKKTDVLDVLINNAGINGGNEPYTALTAKPDEFQAAFEVNVIGVSRVTQAFMSFLTNSEAPIIAAPWHPKAFPKVIIRAKTLFSNPKLCTNPSPFVPKTPTACASSTIK